MTWGSKIYKHTPAELARIRKLLVEASARAAHPTEPTSAELAARRKAVSAAIASRIATALAEGRSSIALVRAAQPDHLDQDMRRFLLATADTVALELDVVGQLSATTGARDAAVNLERAAGQLEAVVTSTLWVDTGWIVQALQLWAAAHVQRCAAVTAGKAQAKRRKDKPASADNYDHERNARIREHRARLVAQNHRSPTSQTATDFDVSRSTVQRILRTPPR